MHFLDDTAVFVLGEEALLLVRAGWRRAARCGAWRRHPGFGRATARVVTGGDDGKVVATDAKGASETIAADAKRRWIDHVAARVRRHRCLVDRQDRFRARQGRSARSMSPSSVGGLAFLPKGLRLAVAHYNGVTLWFPNAQAAPEQLEWKGSHLDVTFSPDGKFLVTAMQEPTLHGWRLADQKHMRMSGYSARVRSLGWTAGGHWLASSGSEQLVLWPFQSKDGPMGKTPRMLAAFQVRVAVVACHPKQEVVAVGYADGTVLLVRVEDGAEVLAKKPGNAPVDRARLERDGQFARVGHGGGRGGGDRPLRSHTAAAAGSR